jgi:hypothetical protein
MNVIFMLAVVRTRNLTQHCVSLIFKVLCMTQENKALNRIEARVSELKNVFNVIINRLQLPFV